jgi:preprotein translocase subunit SecB
MPAKISPLQLDTYFLKEVSYSLIDSLEVVPERVTETKPIGLEISDITTPLADNPKAWRCELIVESANPKEDGNQFYKFKIVLVGFFKTNPDLNDEQARIIAEANCPAVLYSTSREIIATLTRRSPFPATLLPLVTFIKLPNGKSAKPEDTTAKPETKSTAKKRSTRKKIATKSSG